MRGLDPPLVFIVEGHEITRHGITGVLTDAGIAVVGASGTAEQALRRIPALRPDVVIIDDDLPEGAGRRLCAAITGKVPGTMCLMLAGDPDLLGPIAAIRSGAWGYLEKKDPADRLEHAVRRAVRGEHSFDTATLLKPPDSPAARPELPPLTRQEFVVLGHLRHGLTNRQIADELVVTEKTIKHLVSALLLKLEVRSRTAAALLALRAGSHVPGATRGAGSPEAQRLQSVIAACLGLDPATAAQFLLGASRSLGMTVNQLAQDIEGSLRAPHETQTPATERPPWARNDPQRLPQPGIDPGKAVSGDFLMEWPSLARDSEGRRRTRP